MRKLSTFLVAIGVASALAVSAAPVGADVDTSVSTKTSKFCKAVQNLEIPEISDDPSDRERAAATAAALRKVAKKAKGKLKKATRVVADAFDRLAEGDSARDIVTTEYAKSFARFTTATLKCVLGSTKIPDITLPDISLPDNITLPDITLPGR